MGSPSAVRFSRDGDQFHYFWAARRCLRLLPRTSDLVAISVEGASTLESAPGEAIEAGEQVIDLTEYYGSEQLRASTFVNYVQLKHSTKNAGTPWEPSRLEHTLSEFSKRFLALEAALDPEQLNERVSFSFVSNRPLHPDFLESIVDAANDDPCRHPEMLEKLAKYTALGKEKLTAFLKLLEFDGNQEGYLGQRSSLALETGSYLAGSDIDAPIRLKELVTRKATSEHEKTRSITRTDVLRTLEVTEDALYPAPCLLPLDDASIPRDQEIEIVRQIVAAQAPLLIHASGGVGKSVLCSRIEQHLPPDSAIVIYDCFANGDYRRAGSPRHRHKDALVQIANELAGKGLCDPLVPSARADRTDYVKAFLSRLRQSASSVEAQTRSGLVCIVVDAADNAEMIACELGDDPSFIRDLLRESFPSRVRLVVLCRTERQNLLDPPTSVSRVPLEPFSRPETSAFLRSHRPTASEGDVDEFHRLTSQNPRVQATALGQGGTLDSVLRALAPGPTTVDDTISHLLENAISRLKDRATRVEKSQIQSMATALATLRPFVPIAIVAKVAGVEEAAIRSFAADLGRPLLIVADAIQFRDEPTETWFRNTYRATANQLTEFVAVLRPLAPSSAYVSSSLPQLMLEAGQLDELVALALSSESLPANDPVEKRDIEIQRLQFALRASLRAQRWMDAAKLALKAGQEVAGNSRQDTLFQNNTDLLAVFLDPDRIQELVSKHPFSGKWPGVRHAYEASLLSHIQDFRGDARSRLRMAWDWLWNWMSLPDEARRNEQVEDADIAEMAATTWRLEGPRACAKELRRWKPRSVSFRVGMILAEHALDQGLYSDIDDLALAAGNNLYLTLAISFQQRRLLRMSPRSVVERTFRLLGDRRITVELGNGFHDQQEVLGGITAIVESALRYGVASTDVLAATLSRYLTEPPPYGLSSHSGRQRSVLLRAYALRSALRGEQLTVKDLADAKVREALERSLPQSDSREVREFREEVGALLPWHTLRARQLLAPLEPEQLSKALDNAKSESSGTAQYSYRERSFTSDEIAELWFEILAASGRRDPTDIGAFHYWVANQQFPLFIPTWTRLARLAGRTPAFEDDAYTFVQRSSELNRDFRDDAESKAGSYLELARALVGFDRLEAAEYFHLAMSVAGKVGDEIVDRWLALLDLADRAADPRRYSPELAYRLARCGEVAEEYNGKHFEIAGTTIAIGGLSPTSLVAILSRWRDRRFGWLTRLLPIAVESLLTRHQMEPNTACALLWFQAEWDYPKILAEILSQVTDQQERATLFGRALRIIRLEHHSPSIWNALQSLAATYRIDRLGLEEEVSFFGQSSQSGTKPGGLSDELTPEAQSQEDIDQRWREILGDHGVESASGLSAAYGRFRAARPPRSHDDFFRELVALGTVDKGAMLIQAFGESAEFDQYDLRRFLEQIPEPWRERMAVRTAVRELVKRACTRFCFDITKFRYYQALPLSLMAEVSGLAENELITIVLASLGKSTESMGSGRLFSMVGLLAPMLTHDEALEALSFGLGLFEATLTERDGDGPWSAELEPPATMDESFAGYIYAALADPRATIRWQAAHVVAELCSLGRVTVLGNLVERAEKKAGGAFADARLHFYDLHARQWLLIALSRGAMDNPSTVCRYSKFLLDQALKEKHVLMRHFATKALLSLAEHGVAFDAQIINQLKNVNVSQFPTVISESFKRYDLHGPVSNRQDKDDHFIFSYDMDRYWFEPLGRCFAVSSSQIEDIAENVIRQDWHLQVDGHWKKDERHQRGIFQERETWHSHSSSPATDDLSFYLSYHSMLLSAGALLATMPVHQDPDDSVNDFDDWISGHSLTRSDGFWVADRRDPEPLERPDWWNETRTDDWRWSVCKRDFDRVLGLDSARINVWGRWVREDSGRTETIQVSSALVSPQRSRALLRAAQQAEPLEYCIPSAGDDLQIDAGPYLMKGWVDNETNERKLDEFDPWAGTIHVPAPRPAQFVCDALSLKPGDQERTWFHPDEGRQLMLWSQVWGTGDEDSGGNSGRRLQASRALLVAIINQFGLDLIVKVQIERKDRQSKYDRNRGEDYGYIPPYCRLYLLGADGDWTTL
jgi:hypothetical protein